MANRHTLHISHLEPFKKWLIDHQIAFRPGRGDYQVLQVEVPEKGWQVIYSRINMPEHYTVPNNLMGLVREFMDSPKGSRGPDVVDLVRRELQEVKGKLAAALADNAQMRRGWGWVSVSDSLPESYEEVLILYKGVRRVGRLGVDKAYFQLASFDQGNKHSYVAPVEDVSAWCPMVGTNHEGEEILRERLATYQLRMETLTATLDELEQKYRNLLDEKSAEAEKWREEGDMYGWNFHQGLRDGAIEMHINMTQLIKDIRQPQKIDALNEERAKVCDKLNAHLRSRNCYGYSIKATEGFAAAYRAKEEL